MDTGTGNSVSPRAALKQKLTPVGVGTEIHIPTGFTGTQDDYLDNTLFTAVFLFVSLHFPPMFPGII